MSEYYYMSAAAAVESEYIYLDNDRLSEELSSGCRESEFQYIPEKIGKIFLNDESGDELPDFICDELNNVPLISERLKKLFDEISIKNLYYQRVQLIRERDELSVSYWLAVPPRISCLNKARSRINEKWQRAETLVIDPVRTGSYKIFKIADAMNDEIIVKRELRDLIESKGFTKGFLFIKDDSLV